MIETTNHSSIPPATSTKRRSSFFSPPTRKLPAHPTLLPTNQACLAFFNWLVLRCKRMHARQTCIQKQCQNRKSGVQNEKKSICHTIGHWTTNITDPWLSRLCRRRHRARSDKRLGGRAGSDKCLGGSRRRTGAGGNRGRSSGSKTDNRIGADRKH